MRTLLRYLLRFPSAQLIAGILFVALGALLVVAAVGAPNGLNDLISGVVSIAFGAFLLVVFILGRVWKYRARTGVADAHARAQALAASGDLMPIPPVPKQRSKDIGQEDIAAVLGHIAQLDKLPWGSRPAYASPEQAWPTFSRAVALIHGSAGDRRKLAEPIDILVRCPPVLAYTGAAEVLYQLSYLRGSLWVHEGLKQGLRYIARVQMIDPGQPDALVIRAKLLCAYRTEYATRLARESLDRLGRVAPSHPRRAGAEATYYETTKEYDLAAEWLERLLRQPPSGEEESMALLSLASNYANMSQPDAALTVYARIHQRYPDLAWAWHNESLLLEKLGRYDEALRCNQRALSIMEFGVARATNRRLRDKVVQAGGFPG